MTIPNPPLDNLTFDEIFDKVRKKIPTHTQTWTDFNYSDPGITFLDLFSWLAENKIYSLNFIPKRNYLKFLKLLGFRPRPPTPIQIVAKFKNKDEVGNPLKSFPVEKDHFLKSESISDLKFQLDKNIEVFQIDLSEVLLVTSTKPEHYKLAKTLDFERFGWNLELFVDGKGICFGLDIGEGFAENNDAKFANFLVSIKYYLEETYPAGKHCDESFVDNAGFVIWEYAKNDGSDKPHWEKFTANFEDGTNGLTKSGIVSFKIPFRTSDALDLTGYTEKNEEKNKAMQLFWIRCTLKEEITLYDKPPIIIDEISFNCVSATQGTKASEIFPKVPPPNQDEICKKIGVASVNVLGFPHKQLQLSHSPIFGVESVFVIADTRHLELYEIESSLKPWTLVDDFDSSNSTDQHFSVDYATGTISFGDGKNGMVPPRYSKILVNYTFGPQKTILPTGHVFDLYSDRDHTLVSPQIATSRLVLSEGRPNEDLEDLISRAKTELKIPHTAVTLDNIEYIAKNTPNLRIARASARVSGENELDVVIMPVSHAKKPMPTKLLLDAVCHHLDKHRLLTTKIRVSKPKYVEISVTATVKTSTNPTLDQIIDVLNNFLTPLSQSPDYPGWQMGRPVYRSEVISVIEKVAGIDCVESISLSASGETGLYQSKYPNIIIDPLAFVTSGNHVITINHIEPRCQMPSEPVASFVELEDDRPMCEGR